MTEHDEEHDEEHDSVFGIDSSHVSRARSSEPAEP